MGRPNYEWVAISASFFFLSIFFLDEQKESGQERISQNSPALSSGHLNLEVTFFARPKSRSLDPVSEAGSQKTGKVTKERTRKSNPHVNAAHALA